MSIEDNWSYKDVQELKLCQRKDENYLRNYKAFTFVDKQEVEVVRVRKVRSMEYVTVTVPPNTTHFIHVFLPLDTKFHVRKEEKE